MAGVEAACTTKATEGSVLTHEETQTIRVFAVEGTALCVELEGEGWVSIINPHWQGLRRENTVTFRREHLDGLLNCLTSEAYGKEDC